MPHSSVLSWAVPYVNTVILPALFRLKGNLSTNRVLMSRVSSTGPRCHPPLTSGELRGARSALSSRPWPLLAYHLTDSLGSGHVLAEGLPPKEHPGQ